MKDNLGDNNSDAESVYSEYVPSPKASEEVTESEEDEEPEGGYGKSDFPDVKLDSSQIHRFNEVYEDFLAKISAESENSQREPMLLEKPSNLRPVPQTLSEFTRLMPVVYIYADAINHKNEIEKRLVQAQDCHIVDADADAATQREMEGLQIREQIKVFEAVCHGCEKVGRKQDWKKLMQLLLVSCTVLFDDQTHLLFSFQAPTQEVESILARLAKCWRAVFSREICDLGIEEENNKQHLKNWLTSSQQDLNQGLYSDGPYHANPFKYSRIEFEPVPGQTEHFPDSETEQQDTTAGKRKRKYGKQSTINLPDVQAPPMQRQDSWAVSEVLVDQDTESEVEDEPSGHVDSDPESPRFEPTIVRPRPQIVMPGNPNARPMVPTGIYSVEEKTKLDSEGGDADATPTTPPVKQARTSGYIPPWEQQQLLQNSNALPTPTVSQQQPSQQRPTMRPIQPVQQFAPMQYPPQQQQQQQQQPPMQFMNYHPKHVVMQQPQSMQYMRPVGLQPVYVQQPAVGQMAVPSRPIMVHNNTNNGLQAPNQAAYMQPGFSRLSGNQGVQPAGSSPRT